MKLRMKITHSGSPDGQNLFSYQAGQEYSESSTPRLDASLAAVFLREGWAEEVADEAASFPAPAVGDAAPLEAPAAEPPVPAAPAPEAPASGAAEAAPAPVAADGAPADPAPEANPAAPAAEGTASTPAQNPLAPSKKSASAETQG